MRASHSIKSWLISRSISEDRTSICIYESICEQSNKIEHDWVYSEPMQKLLPFKLKHEWRLLISWNPKLIDCDVPAYSSSTVPSIAPAIMMPTWCAGTSSIDTIFSALKVLSSRIHCRKSCAGNRKSSSHCGYIHFSTTRVLHIDLDSVYQNPIYNNFKIIK